MKSAMFFVFFACCIYLTHSWTMYGKKKDGEPGDCFDSAFGVGEMKFGDEKKGTGDCVGIICQSNGDILYQGCGAVGVQEGCHLEEADLSKPYPDCCIRNQICDDKNEI